MGLRRGKGLYFAVLAGGDGKRMRSALPKVLHPVLGSPMISYPVSSALSLKPARIVIVAGKHLNAIKEALAASSPSGGWPLEFALQEKPMGTAHALSCAINELGRIDGSLIVLNGDFPLIRPETIRKLASLHVKTKNALSIGTFVAREPGAYGRIKRGPEGRPVRIIEKSDLQEEDSGINEVNSGLYMIEPAALKLLPLIKPNPKNGEYYITDLLEIVLKKGLMAGAYPIGAEEELAGVNTPAELGRAEAILREKLISGFSSKGVRFIDPSSAFIDARVKIAPGAVIYPNVYLEGGTSIGKGCVIYPNVRIEDSAIGDGAVIKDSSVIEQSRVGAGARIGPFAHLRPGAVIGRDAAIGNFVEIKKSLIGRGTKAMHLSYIGDAEVGKGVNVGAGTITCNYDGVNKNKTIIGDGVFVGSDSQLVAPVKVGKGSYVAAGSTITKDVPPGALAINRVEQKNKEGWAKRKKRPAKGKSQA